MTITDIPQKQLTAKEIAAQELRDEVRKEAVAKMKKKLKEIHLAKIALANLERELADLEREIDAGI